MSRYVVTATWDDAPHLSARDREEMWASIPPFQRDARTKGIPQLGSGAVYQVPEDAVKCEDFEIPKHWPRAYALDAASSGPTAAVWGAYDRESQTAYIYAVYKREQAEPSIHAAAVKAKGEWIPGVGDVAAIANSDGEQFIDIYRKLGLHIQLADKGVESGIQDTWEMMSAGRLKVFASCRAWFEEFRLYRRDEKGRIVKQNDHLMDSTRYYVKSGIAIGKTNLPKSVTAYKPIAGAHGWLG